jgi:hypothetical protein
MAITINLGLTADATGTVDVITATYSPAPTLVDKKILFLVSAGANTSTTPTFNPNSLGAKTITKYGGQALAAGDIAAAGFVALLEYNLANTRWELLNPASSSGGITGLTTNELVYGNSSTTIASLPVATYPSLTEFSYVKGVSGSIQPQINDRLIAANNLSDLVSPATAVTNLGLSSAASLNKGAIGVTYDGMGGVITTNNYTSVIIPYAATITSWRITSLTPSDGIALSGSIVIDIKRSGTSIIGAGNKPTLASASTNNAAASAWTSVAVAANDQLDFYVVSATTVLKVFCEIIMTKS